MIQLTRLDGREFLINAGQIETVEATPDTVISLVSGRKHVVREEVDAVVDRVVEYQRRLNQFPRDPADEV